MPASGAYLGAYAGPASNQIQATAQLEQQIGRKLAIHAHYYSWTERFPDAGMADDAANGRIPIVSWSCGDPLTGVANGLDDTNVIIPRAQSIKAYGKPVFIRWMWEMNLPDSGTHPECYAALSGAAAAAAYVAAYQHIWAVFHAQGVTNVAWLWNPSGGNEAIDAAPYYPGASYVDWVGIDAYDRTSPQSDFSAIIGSFYTEFTVTEPLKKPMMVAETGACAAYQPQYLAEAQAELKTTFPLVKAFEYFDSKGAADCAWTLTAAGVGAFGQMGADPYFGITGGS